jgi:hypothetical protein
VIGNDNIGTRILKVLKDKGIKPTPFELSKDISRGYLKRAAESGTGIGSEIVEKILLEFSDIDSYWLITGKELSRNTDKNIQPQQNDSEAAVRAELKRMRDEIRLLKELSAVQAKALLHFTDVNTVE